MKLSIVSFMFLVLMQFFASCNNKPEINEIKRIDIRGIGFKSTHPFRVTEEYLKERQPEPISIIDSSVLSKIRLRINNLDRYYFSGGCGIFVVGEIHCKDGSFHKMIFGFDKINLDGRMYHYDDKLEKLIWEATIDPCHYPFLYNLKRKDCTEDTVFKERYFESIKKLELPYTKTSKPVKVTEFQNAMYFLIATTGIQPTGYDIEYGIYYSHEEFKEDKIKWKVWYRKNKYKMTNSRADSLLNKYMTKYQGVK